MNEYANTSPKFEHFSEYFSSCLNSFETFQQHIKSYSETPDLEQVKHLCVDNEKFRTTISIYEKKFAFRFSTHLADFTPSVQIIIEQQDILSGTFEQIDLFTITADGRTNKHHLQGDILNITNKTDALVIFYRTALQALRKDQNASES